MGFFDSVGDFVGGALESFSGLAKSASDDVKGWITEYDRDGIPTTRPATDDECRMFGVDPDK